ncbi:MAG: adenosylcobinamide-GDP ribazoletransferase, partial [Pseudomonadota bacterium]
REGGIGAGMAEHLPRTPGLCVVVIIALALFALLPMKVFVPTALAVAAVCWWVAASSRKHLGGFTGDVAGAQVELVEVVTLLTLALCLGDTHVVG